MRAIRNACLLRIAALQCSLLTGVLYVYRSVRASSVDREAPRTAAAAATAMGQTGETPRFGRLVAFLLVIPLLFSLYLLSLPPPPLLFVPILTSNSSSSSPCPHSHLLPFFFIVLFLSFFLTSLLFHLFSLSTFSPPPLPLYPPPLLFLNSPSSSISFPCPHSHLLVFVFILFSSFFSLPLPLPHCPHSHLPLIFILIFILTSSPSPHHPFSVSHSYHFLVLLTSPPYVTTPPLHPVTHRRHCTSQVPPC